MVQKLMPHDDPDPLNSVRYAPLTAPYDNALESPKSPSSSLKCFSIFIRKNKNLEQRERGKERKELRPRSGADHPQAQVVAPEVRMDPDARRRPTAPRGVAPGTAA